MIVWLVAAPVVILLLALAGANWKTFHLAYCKHLMSSDDPMTQGRGLARVIMTHMRQGMSKSQVERLVRPLVLRKLESSLAIEAYEIGIEFPSEPDQRMAFGFTFDEAGLGSAELFTGNQRTGFTATWKYELRK